MPTPTLEPINRIVELLRGFMELKPARCMLYNQRWKLPEDDGIYVTVALLTSKPYGSTKSYETSLDGSALLEIIELRIQETYSINIFSRSQDALNRKEEVVMAFNSTAAQQMCEAHALKLATLPVSFVDTSLLEGAARLNRYTVTMAILRGTSKTNIVQYFDHFDNPPRKLLINP